MKSLKNSKKYKVIDSEELHDFLDDDYIKDFKNFFDSSVEKHNALIKKTHNIKKDIIDQILDVILIYFAKNKIKVKKNQIGVGINDSGYIVVKIHLNKKSSIDYPLMTIDFNKNIQVYRINDKLNLIDHLLNLFKNIII